MKKIVKFSYIIVLCFMLLFTATVMTGCNNPTDSEAQYQYITHSWYAPSSEYRVYTFQINVENKTSEDQYIVVDEFRIRLELEYTNSSNGNKTTRFESVDFGIYTDEECNNKITMSKVIIPGVSESIYIKTTLIKNDFGPTENYSSIKPTNITLIHDILILKTVNY